MRCLPTRPLSFMIETTSDLFFFGHIWTWYTELVTKGYKFIFLTESKKPGENFFSDKYFNKIITQSCVCIYIYICMYIYIYIQLFTNMQAYVQTLERNTQEIICVRILKFCFF